MGRKNNKGKSFQRQLLQPGRAIHAVISLVRREVSIAILISAVLGTITGLALAEAPVTRDEYLAWIALPGRLFLSLLQMLLVPLIFSSVAAGIAESRENAGRMLLRLTGYFTLTTAIAVAIGLALASFAFRLPDTNVSTGMAGWDWNRVPDEIVRLVPENIVSAAAKTEFLSVILFAAFTGVAVGLMKKSESGPFLDFLRSLSQVMLKVTGFVMALAPLAAFSLIASALAKAGWTGLEKLGIYILVVMTGLTALMFVYTVIITVNGRLSALSFFRKIAPLQLLAFTTSSSSAVLPVSLRTAQNNLGVPGSVSRTVLPIGATINMDGTALYQSVAIAFLAYLSGIQPGISELALILLLTVGASIGTPGTPGVGLIVLGGVAAAVGIPTEGLGLILGVDRILDMFRTVVNVTGDLVATVLFTPQRMKLKPVK